MNNEIPKCPINCPTWYAKPDDGLCPGCNIPMFQISCKCGYSDIHEAFETFDSEPDNPSYQCPECGVEWSINGLRKAKDINNA